MPKPPKARAPRWRIIFMIVLLCAATASLAFAARSVERFVKDDPRFAVQAARTGSTIAIQGANFSSRPRILQAFASDAGRSVFLVPLAERRRRLLAIDWVRDASVSRLWPNRLVIRVHERKPAAFVNLPGAGLMLIDSDGVLLPQPPRAHFSFPILNGVTAEQSEQERAARVQSASRMLDDLGLAARDVSEVNAADPDDLRVVAQIQGRAVELRLGDDHYSSRYQNFVNHFQEISRTSPWASAFDLRLDDRIITK